MVVADKEVGKEEVERERQNHVLSHGERDTHFKGGERSEEQ